MSGDNASSICWWEWDEQCLENKAIYKAQEVTRSFGEGRRLCALIVAQQPPGWDTWDALFTPMDAQILKAAFPGKDTQTGGSDILLI